MTRFSVFILLLMVDVIRSEPNISSEVDASSSYNDSYDDNSDDRQSYVVKGIHVSKLCFRWLRVAEQQEQCQFRGSVMAFYFNKSTMDCQSYEACVPENIVFRRKRACLRTCLPLYLGVPSSVASLTAEPKVPDGQVSLLP